MSSSSPPTSSSQTSTSSAPFFTNPAPTPSPHNSGGEDSSSLYLFTFLATLFLLLLISCGVILRSFVLRRRLRRSVEDALTAGVILPSTFGGRRSRRDFGEKPTFYDAWVAPGGEKWEYIMPISAQIKPKPLSGTYNIPNADTPTPPRPLNPFSQWRSGTASSSSSPTTAQTQTPSTPLTSSYSMQGANTEEGSVQVSVLVAMPSSRSKSSSENEEIETVPEMVVGVVHLPYRASASAAVSSSHLDGRGD